MSRHPLNPETEREVATSIHLLALSALASNPKWTIENIVFHGGTSVSFAWNSPRFSEDLDFVVARDADMAAEMAKVHAFVQQGMLTRHAGSVVSLRDRTKQGDRMSVFMLDAELPDTIGKVKVKVEFWKAPPEAVRNYGRDSVYRPLGRADIAPLFSVATPERVMMDKINAIAHREYLKWRDIFDVWFIENNFHERLRERFSAPDVFSSAMDVSAALYGRAGADAVAGLREFVARPDADILALAERDLKPWLPPHLWEKFWPDTVARMLETTKKIAVRSIDLLEPALPPDAAPAPRTINFR